jgi:hypothetical protein
VSVNINSFFGTGRICDLGDLSDLVTGRVCDLRFQK